jgi:hypothetical protein
VFPVKLQVGMPLATYMFCKAELQIWNICEVRSKISQVEIAAPPWKVMFFFFCQFCDMAKVAIIHAKI